MSAAYVDSSYLLAILLGEPRARSLRNSLERFQDILSGDLLVAEVLSASVREGVPIDGVIAALQDISLILPGRSLQPEMREILRQGRLRGADLWHLACAMFVAGDRRPEVPFLSRDEAQRRIANRLGFPTP